MGFHIAYSVTLQDINYVFEWEFMREKDLVDSLLHKCHEMIELLAEESLPFEWKQPIQDLASHWKVDFLHIHNILLFFSLPKGSLIIDLFKCVRFFCLAAWLFWPLN